MNVNFKLALDVLMVLLSMYISMIAPKLSFLNNSYVRIVFLVVIAYISTKDLRSAILLAIVFLVSVNFLRTEMFENYETGYGKSSCLMDSDCKSNDKCHHSGFCMSNESGNNLIPTDTRTPFRPSR